METEPLQPNSSGHPKSPKLMDLCQQVGSVNVQTPDEISESQAFDFPRYNEKRCGVRLHEVQIHCIVDLMNRDCELFLRGFQDQRIGDKKGFYTPRVLLSWNRYFESFMY